MTGPHLKLVPPTSPIIEIFSVVKLGGALLVIQDGKVEEAKTVSHAVDKLFEFAEPVQATDIRWPIVCREYDGP